METAYVFLNCDPGYEETIIKDLKRIDSISEVCGLYGEYDIIAKVENSERDKLRKIIMWNIRKLQHVRSTLTLMKIQGQD
jgi:DNA-binding Lrp family transcriptional regulator